MALGAGALTAGTSRRLGWAGRGIPVLILSGVLLVSAPMFVAGRTSLTSDESLYLAEAYNIAHGKGMTYPSGDAITHRAPLFPALLAPAVRLGGPAAAYDVTPLIVCVNALLLALLAWRMAGTIAALAAGVTAASSAFLSGLGSTLYLDPLQSTFLLVALFALCEAMRSGRIRSFAAAGVALGLAFLVKESAIEWAPLGVVAWLTIPSLRNITGARGALALTLAFLACVCPWWIFVWLQTSRIFMLGHPSLVSAAILVGGGLSIPMFAVAIAAWPHVPDRVRRRIGRLSVPAAAVLIIGWGCFLVFGLTRYSGWPYPNHYWVTVPRYLIDIAPEVQPLFLLAVAWPWIVYRAARDDGHARLILATALLFAPFALFAANRSLELRDVLPLVYLSYLCLGISVASLLRKLRNLIRTPVGEAMLFSAAVVMGAVFALQQATLVTSRSSAASEDPSSVSSWNSPFALRIAAWMNENLPPGARVLSSRLYFSSLYVNTEGRFEIRQIPTVRVDVDPRAPGLLTPRSNLFRWGDEALRPARADDTWLYLRQFPGKGYWVALGQQELLEYIRDHDIDYLVLTGEDAAFSSLSYADYLSGHPAFHLVHTEAASSAAQMFAYSVDRSKLGLMSHALTIAPRSFKALSLETGLDRQQLESAVGGRLRVTDMDGGLSDRERWAAIAGISLAEP